MTKVVLFGNGPVASGIYSALTHNSPYEVAAFTVDQEYIKENTLFGLPLIPFSDVASIYSPDEYKMHIAVGYVKVNKLRAERYRQAKAMGYELISHVSPKAITASGLNIGENSVIGANSMIGPLVEIGNNVIIGCGTIIGHHGIVKDHCFVSDGVMVAGGVTIEPYCFLGVGSIIRNKVSIARECVIGAGALILEDTREREVYMGKAADLLPISSDQLLVS